MITVKELKRWLDTLEDDDSVSIDEGGISLLSDQQPDAYLEVGGEPSKCSCGRIEDECLFFEGGPHRDRT
jgi:hypothetical protein